MCLSLVLYHSVSKADSYHTPTVDIVLIRLGIQNILTNFIYWKANVRAHEVFLKSAVIISYPQKIQNQTNKQAI
jgi:hypothetical protein